MCILWKVKGQNEWFRTRILNFHTAIIQGSLGNKSDFWIELAENHILMVIYRSLSYPTTSAIGVEKRGALWTKIGLGTRCQG